MALKLLSSVNLAFQKIEQVFIYSLFRSFPPPDGLCLVEVNVDNRPSQQKFSIKDLVEDGFLWAVPKHRRTIERRLQRKFGDPYYVLKILKPKNHLRVCPKCGHYYEVGVLCAHCYAKIREETKAIQEKIQSELGLEPVEKDVIVLYDNERTSPDTDEFYKNKRVIEMKKSRPSWFSKNLLQKTTQNDAATSDVKPTQLG